MYRQWSDAKTKKNKLDLVQKNVSRIKKETRRITTEQRRHEIKKKEERKKGKKRARLQLGDERIIRGTRGETAQNYTS